MANEDEPTEVEATESEPEPKPVRRAVSNPEIHPGVADPAVKKKGK